MAPVVVARALTKHFGSVRAVQDVDLDVSPGEVVGFLGPNGAGKSTTIRLLLGQLRPTSGGATIAGLDPSDPRSRASVGYLPGDLHLDPRRTGRDVLDLLAALRARAGRPVVPGRAEALCERFGVDPTRRIGDLSRGNRQKLGVVQAFAADPDVVVLDEPTSGLDPLQQASFAELVAERRDAGAAVLLSSHVLPEVERVADRVAIIREGRIVGRDTLDALRRRARQRLTLALDVAAGPVDEPALRARLDRVAGLVRATVSGADLEAVVEGPVQPLLDAVAAVGVVRITSHDDDLDDLFLHLYRGDDEGGTS